MISKHTSFSESEVMRELERLAKKEDGPGETELVKNASVITEYGSTGDLFADIVALARGLREKGFDGEAEDLENKLLIFKTAETHLYKVFEEEGDDLIDFSHQEGDVEIAPAQEGRGKVETIVSQHKKIVDMINKKPTGKLAGGKPCGVTKSAQLQEVELGRPISDQTAPSGVIEDEPSITVTVPEGSGQTTWNDIGEAYTALKQRFITLFNTKEDSGQALPTLEISKPWSATSDQVEVVNLKDNNRSGLFGGAISIEIARKWGFENEISQSQSASASFGTKDIIDLLAYYCHINNIPQATFRAVFNPKTKGGPKAPWESMFTPKKIKAFNDSLVKGREKIATSLNSSAPDTILAQVPNMNSPADLKVGIKNLNQFKWYVADIRYPFSGTESRFTRIRLKLLVGMNEATYADVQKFFDRIDRTVDAVIYKLKVRLKELTPSKPPIGVAKKNWPVWALQNQTKRWLQVARGYPRPDLQKIDPTHPQIPMTVYPSDVNELEKRLNQLGQAVKGKRSLQSAVPQIKKALNICNTYKNNVKPGGWIGSLNGFLNAIAAAGDIFSTGTVTAQNAKNFRTFLNKIESYTNDARTRRGSAEVGLFKKAQNPFLKKPPKSPKKHPKPPPGKTSSTLSAYWEKNHNDAWEAVKQMQTQLKHLGYKKISVDGVWGDTETNGALKKAAIRYKLNLDSTTTYKDKGGADKVEQQAKANSAILAKALATAGKAKPAKSKVLDVINRSSFGQNVYSFRSTASDAEVATGDFASFVQFDDFLTLNRMSTPVDTGYVKDAQQSNTPHTSTHRGPPPKPRDLSGIGEAAQNAGPRSGMPRKAPSKFPGRTPAPQTPQQSAFSLRTARTFSEWNAALKWFLNRAAWLYSQAAQEDKNQYRDYYLVVKSLYTKLLRAKQAMGNVAPETAVSANDLDAALSPKAPPAQTARRQPRSGAGMNGVEMGDAAAQLAEFPFTRDYVPINSADLEWPTLGQRNTHPHGQQILGTPLLTRGGFMSMVNHWIRSAGWSSRGRLDAVMNTVLALRKDLLFNTNEWAGNLGRDVPNVQKARAMRASLRPWLSMIDYQIIPLIEGTKRREKSEEQAMYRH